ncbi:MAG: hypothetical protein LBB64_01435 [Dysgonamonadaceae bacterium]|jgi:hypothetical protein|nr:hypothetical protein [Dysgonamonadaceae bacterium]
MYRQVLVPDAENSSITIPRKWYGTEVEVLIFPIGEEVQPRTAKRVEEKPEIDYRDMKQVMANSDKKEVERINKIFDKYLIPMNDFKFDRDEANNYD